MFLHYITVYSNCARGIIEIHPFTMYYVLEISGKFDLVTPYSTPHTIHEYTRGFPHGVDL